MDLSQLSKTELLAKCEEFGFTKCKSKNKYELIEIIHSKNSIEPKNVEVILVNNDYDNSTDNSNDLLFYLDKLLKTYTLQFLARELNLASGTITRWIELGDIPKNYEFDILKLSNVKINYSKYSTKENTRKNKI